MRTALLILSGGLAVLFLAYSFLNAARLSLAWETTAVVNGTDVSAGVLLLLAALAWGAAELLGRGRVRRR